MDPKIFAEPQPFTDTARIFHIQTPGGLIITLDKPPVEGIVATDEQAARQLATLTGCRITIERTTKITVAPR